METKQETKAHFVMDDPTVAMHGEHTVAEALELGFIAEDEVAGLCETPVIEFTTKISDGRGKEAASVEATFRVDFSAVDFRTALLGCVKASSVPVTIRGAAKRAFDSFDALIAWAKRHATKGSPYELRYADVGKIEFYTDPEAREEKERQNAMGLIAKWRAEGLSDAEILAKLA